MSDGVPTRQGRVARQIKVFFENPMRKPYRVIAEDLNHGYNQIHLFTLTAKFKQNKMQTMSVKRINP